jgi:hypothetical protein
VPNFPTSLDSLPNPTPTTLRNDPGFSLAGQVSTLNDIAEALELKLGTGSGAPTGAGGMLRQTAAGASGWGQLLPADIAAGTGLRLIATTTLGATATTIDFPNISQAYAGLYCIGVTANASASPAVVVCRFSFDGTTFDAGSNYDWVYVNATNGGMGTSATIADSGLLVAENGTLMFTPFSFELPAYAVSGIQKGIFSRMLVSTAQTVAGYQFIQTAGVHKSTVAPIKGLRLAVTTGTFQGGTRVMLYGLPSTLG